MNRDAALAIGAAAKSGEWYSLADLQGFLPFETDSVTAWKLHVRWPDGHEVPWLPHSRIRGAVEWCVRYEGGFQI